jgi:hypothetical protein
MVTRIDELGTLAVTNNQRTLRRSTKANLKSYIKRTGFWLVAHCLVSELTYVLSWTRYRPWPIISLPCGKLGPATWCAWDLVRWGPGMIAGIVDSGKIIYFIENWTCWVFDICLWLSTRGGGRGARSGKPFELTMGHLLRRLTIHSMHGTCFLYQRLCKCGIDSKSDVKGKVVPLLN